MFAVDGLVVVLLLGAAVFGTIVLVMGSRDRGAVGHGKTEWRVTHRDVEGETRVLLQKVTRGGVSILNEHVVAGIPVDDPAYDEKFLAAMNTARERRALFESEEE